MRTNRYVTRLSRISDRRTLTLVLIIGASLTRGVSGVVYTKIPVAPVPVGAGARGVGLINLEKPEVSVVGAWRTTGSDPSSLTSGISYEPQNWCQGEINFMSFAQPLRIGGTDAVLSVNYHQVYDLGMQSRSTKVNTATQQVTTISEGRSDGGISAYSLAGGFSVPFYPRITAGASFNWYDRSLLYDNIRRVKNVQQDWVAGTTPPMWVSTTVVEELDDFRGYNFTFGLLWDVYERQENLLTLGFVCHTPFTARVDQEVLTIHQWGTGGAEYDRLDIHFPLSLGVGANYRFSDRFSTAVDVQWTDWSQFGYNGAPTTLTDDALAVRLGFERLWFSESGKGSVYALRGGVFYEPRPAWSDILPVYGVSLGLGWTFKKSFSLDFAYQFRWGEGDDFTADGTTRFDYGIEEHLLVTSLIVYL
jgi:hypothetical protein